MAQIETVRECRMLIGDGWVDSGSGETFEIRNPATWQVLGRTPRASAEDIDRAVAAARRALPKWAKLDASERGRLLMRWADRIEEERDLISRTESTDNGRPLRETAAQASIVAKWYRYFGGMADKIEGATIPVEGPYLNYTKRVPVGVCAALTPWNHPLLIATKKVAPALACGNTMVLKPSELAPLSVLELGRLALEAGIPEGVLNIVTGERATGEAIVTHPGIDRVDLTGSTPTAVAIATAAAPTMKRLGFELGGKAANIVFADADMERAVAGAVWAGFIGQGQTCIAGSRVLVEQSAVEHFSQRLAGRIGRIRIGDPLDTETQMGPVITPSARQRIAAYVDEARESGAEVITGGRPPEHVAEGLSPDGFYTPTVLRVDDPSMRVAQEEIFGPVVTMIPFTTEQHAIEIANSTPFGLGCAVWTKDVTRAHRTADALRAGIVWINDYHRNDPASPWGGFGLSGYGRENGFYAVEMFTEVKSVWVPTEERPMDWYDSSAPSRLN